MSAQRLGVRKKSRYLLLSWWGLEDSLLNVVACVRSIGNYTQVGVEFGTRTIVRPKQVQFVKRFPVSRP
jgi:hypothetical protein